MARAGLRGVRNIIALLIMVSAASCASSRKPPARPGNDSRVTAVERGEETGRSAGVAATVTASTGDDLSWLSPVYFALDSADLSADTRDALVLLHRWLEAHPGTALTIEGHCDEQGTTEYNIGLGQRRAQAMADYLVRLGTGESRLGAVSFGAERPAVDGHDEVAWARNRRGEFRVTP